MRLILRDDVDGLGSKGDVVDVAAGYARNFLVPQGKAMQAAKGSGDMAAAMRRTRDRRDAQARVGADEIARLLVPAIIAVEARVGQEGHLYGSVTTTDVADAVKTQLGIELDRRILSIEEPIRTVGTHEVRAKLHPEVQAIITVEVSGEA